MIISRIRIFISKLTKASLLLSFPTLIFYGIYSNSAIQVCFLPGSSTYQVETLLSQALTNRYKQVQIFEPLLKFADAWFIYDLSVANHLYSTAFVVGDSYTQSTSTLIEVSSKEIGTTTPIQLAVGNQIIVAHGLSLEEIPGETEELSLVTTPSKEIMIPPKTTVRIDIGPNSSICYIATLNPTFLPLVWIVLLIFTVGALTTLKEIFHFVNRPIGVHFFGRPEAEELLKEAFLMQREEWLYQTLKRMVKNSFWFIITNTKLYFVIVYKKTVEVVKFSLHYIFKIFHDKLE